MFSKPFVFILALTAVMAAFPRIYAAVNIRVATVKQRPFVVLPIALVPGKCC